MESCVADQSGSLSVIVKVLQWIGEETPHSGRWRPTMQLEQWPANEFVSPHAWYCSSDDIVVVQ